ncbi:hypothetical protein [Ferrimicrobium sp.]|uniref:hypothetical protein n=1 Tax=Ferrimicrobium sp. TaxID=2926050 RepID=UPI0026339C61|nr:hypothetical protein [Ferrimicrobium sp.]
MTPLVCLLTGGRSRRMGKDKAGLYRDCATQAIWLSLLVRQAVGPRVIEVGGTWTHGDAYLDAGLGPAFALHEAARAGALGHSGTVIVLPIDLYRLEATGLRWFVRESLRMPSVLVVDQTPSWVTFGAPVEILLRRPQDGSLRALTSQLRPLRVPLPLEEQFRDSDYPWELPTTVSAP